MLIREPLYEAKLSLKPHESVILANAGIQLGGWLKWIPAFAGMTKIGDFCINLSLFSLVQSSKI